MLGRGTYVYGLWRFDHISEFSREILGCTLEDKRRGGEKNREFVLNSLFVTTLFEYLELRLAGFIHKIVIVGAPDYLSSRLVG
jgi:hypothetical protein